MARRAFSLVELLAVVAVLAVLAAILFPVFARSKARAKLTNCGSRLRGFAVALNLYRADHDGLGYRWTTDLDHYGHRYPYNAFEPMKAYLGDGSVLWCPEPNADPSGVSGWNSYSYRTWNTDVLSDAYRLLRRRTFKPVPGSVVAYCANHTENRYDPRDPNKDALRVGTYPFVREDTSLGLARNEVLEVWYYSADGWFQKYRWPSSTILRFPGEPWPPEVEE